MPALESRRVRTQPLTVTGTSAGARPARISRVLNSRVCIDRELQRQSDFVQLLSRLKFCVAAKHSAQLVGRNLFIAPLRRQLLLERPFIRWRNALRLLRRTSYERPNVIQ